jgi:hypothetical protein
MTEIDQAAPKGNGIAQHSSASNEHYTPRIIVEVAREAMGSIELDPASCELANRENVRAARFFTKEDDGLSRPWDAKTIFVNPPGGRLTIAGKRTNRSQAQAFWHKAVEEWAIDASNKSIVGQPTHANVLACITSRRDVVDRFHVAATKSLGECITPASWVLG